jgi:hypothetical protein
VWNRQSGNQTNCNSPLTLSNLTIGDHLFQIQPYFYIYDVVDLENGTHVFIPGSYEESADLKSFIGEYCPPTVQF